MTPNRSVIFQKIVDEVLIPSTHLTIQNRPIDLSLSPPDGGLLLKNYYLSVDPYMRTLLKSRNPKFVEGDVVCFFNEKALPFHEYTVCDAAMAEIPFKVHNPYNVDVRHLVGALGPPELRSYGCLYEIGKPKAGETILLVGQLAKEEGLRAIGNAGSDEKLRYIVEELSFDGGFNYKTEKAREALEKLVPQGIDVYYDNVGRPIGGIILAQCLCSMICDYNKKPEDRYGVKSLREIFIRRITMQGFIVVDENILKHFPTMQETIGYYGRNRNAIGAFLGTLKGDNNGKALVQLADLDKD
ncbi:NAD(P)-binding protein [Mytilinidion resinicola]|uniref:NAD(P)-binding protein n=1 Tax=Mytilinidion resinicola TaxID=574789 RepID=A0A6A6YWU8_9PEZI|nr:NAD(P)-binding protein [Mytilinidion resinicola]KAF2812873.1 NAD(P)-binding protein [Mytilinidion resinicola]